jgi:hypothetical protein
MSILILSLIDGGFMKFYLIIFGLLVFINQNTVKADPEMQSLMDCLQMQKDMFEKTKIILQKEEHELSIKRDKVYQRIAKRSDLRNISTSFFSFIFEDTNNLSRDPEDFTTAEGKYAAYRRKLTMLSNILADVITLNADVIHLYVKAFQLLYSPPQDPRTEHEAIMHELQQLIDQIDVISLKNQKEYGFTLIKLKCLEETKENL